MPELQKRGIGLAVISYDAPTTLKAFSDKRGIVTARSFETSYQERASATSVIATARSGAAGVSRPSETPHLTVTTSASDTVVAPGIRFSLLVDVVPKPRMHVYSPDQTTYIPIAISLEADDAIRAHTPKFPPSEIYVFKPLNERQRVYSKPFRIVQDVTATLTIKGTLNYQACDDKVCYRPASVPLSWTVCLEPLAR